MSDILHGLLEVGKRAGLETGLLEDVIERRERRASEAKTEDTEEPMSNEEKMTSKATLSMNQVKMLLGRALGAEVLEVTLLEGAVGVEMIHKDPHERRVEMAAQIVKALERADTPMMVTLQSGAIQEVSEETKRRWSQDFGRKLPIF